MLNLSALILKSNPLSVWNTFREFSDEPFRTTFAQPLHFTFWHNIQDYCIYSVWSNPVNLYMYVHTYIHSRTCCTILIVCTFTFDEFFNNFNLIMLRVFLYFFITITVFVYLLLHGYCCYCCCWFFYYYCYYYYQHHYYYLKSSNAYPELNEIKWSKNLM